MTYYANFDNSDYFNLTQHTAFAVFDKNGKSIAPLFEANKNKVATSLSDTYTQIVDYAVTKAQLGGDGYQKVVQDVCRAMVHSGIKTVDYATGYKRRLESAVRQNVLWGIKQCNQNTADMIGEDFGANGYEISYHSNPRLGHADMAGKIYAIGRGRTVNGIYYPSFSDVAHLLEEYGCLHFKFSVLLGISEPAYTREQLEELKAQDGQMFDFEGETYTRQKGKEMQSRLETAIVRQKELANMAKEAGDDDLRREAQGKINLLTSKYAKLSEASGLPTKVERLKLAKSVDKSTESSIIKEKRASDGRYKATQEKIDDLISNDLQNIHFSVKPIYNPRIRCDGKTSIVESKSGRVLYIEKIEIGNQTSYSAEYLEDTIIHEELEARIALRSRNSNKYNKLYYGTDKDRHNYINKVIKRFFKMKGWWHDEG